jgi:ferredoxin
MPGIIPRGHQLSNYIRDIKEEECIGCGVCVDKCKQNAIYLVHRDEEHKIPKDGTEQAIRYLIERGLDANEIFKKKLLLVIFCFYNFI